VEFCSFSFVLVRFFSFFVHFWVVLGSFFLVGKRFFFVVIPRYHKSYSLAGRLKIGFVWHIRVLSVLEFFPWFARGGF